MTEAPPRVTWLEATALTVCLGVRFALGLVWLPQTLFEKYPESVRLLRAGLLQKEESADFSPLYLLLNLLLEPHKLRIIQAGLVTVCLVSAFAVARHLFGRAAGFVAVGALSLAIPLFLYEATLEPDLLVVATGCAGLCLLITARNQGIRGLAGLLLGLSAAARPSGLLFLFAAVGVLAARRADRSRAAVLLLGGVVGFIGPAVGVRRALGGDVGATMSVGAVFHMGNRPESTGVGAQPPTFIKLLERQQRSADMPDAAHALYRAVARAATQEDLSAFATERYWIARSLAFIRYEPGGYLRLLGRKTLFFFLGDDAYDISPVRGAEGPLFAKPLLRAPWVSLLGLSGFVVASWRKRKFQLGMLSVYLICTLVTGLVFYVLSRHSLARIPLLTIYAGGWATVFHRDRTVSYPVGGGLAALGLLLWIRTSSAQLDAAQRVIQRSTESAAQSGVMAEERRAGRYTEATNRFRNAYAAAFFAPSLRDLRGIPWESQDLAADAGRAAVARYGMARETDVYFAARLAVDSGHCQTALPLLLHSKFRWALFDDLLDPSLDAADCCLMHGDLKEAAGLADDSLQTRPGNLRGLALKIVLGERLKKSEAARRARTELFALHDPFSANGALARAYLQINQFEEARTAASVVVDAFPQSGIAQYDLGLSLLGLGFEKQAVEAYAKALEAFPAHAFRSRLFDAAVQHQLARPLVTPAFIAFAADHAQRMGRIADAISLQKRANPQVTPVPAAWQERLEALEEMKTPVPDRYVP